MKNNLNLLDEFLGEVKSNQETLKPSFWDRLFGTPKPKQPKKLPSSTKSLWN
jgi:hypothetical protein